jgi:hypothetical protein
MTIDTTSTLCPACHGKGWLRLSTGWPIECDDCTPTKTVKGRVTLDKAKVAALERARKPLETVAPCRYVGAGATHHYVIPADTE